MSDEAPRTDESAGVEVAPSFSIRAGPWGLVHSPIHETITLSALISTGYTVALGTTLDNADNGVWEYIRGTVWNDDPDCLLFMDGQDNHIYSSGATWLTWFKLGKTQWANNDNAKWRNATGRSHWGDLQFLHCMAAVPGELPTDTKHKFMTWLEIMWKLANNESGITPETIIDQTALKEFLPLKGLPANWMPLEYLLAKTTAFRGLDIRRRALGSMFHFIQDSYALGHTRRVLLNSEDKESDQPLRFKSGIADRWGALENFHVYNGQSDDHELYDHAKASFRDPTNLSNLDQFNYLIGCRDAVDKCIGLIKLKQAGKTWETGVQAYLDTEVFPLSPNATPADTRVWP